MPRPPDIGWQFGTMIGGNRHHVQCNYCHRIMIGGITRFKKHLASKRGEIKGCDAVPKEIRDIMAHHLATRKPRRPNKRRRKTISGTSEAPSSTNYSVELDTSNPDMIDARQEVLAFNEEVQTQKTDEEQFEVGTRGFFDSFTIIQYNDEQDFVPPRATDIGWAHCILVDGDRQKIECKYCHKLILGGGISRLKQHLAGERGNIAPCDQVPDDVKEQIQQHLSFKALENCSVQRRIEEYNGDAPIADSVSPLPAYHKGRWKDGHEGNSNERKKMEKLYISPDSGLAQSNVHFSFASQDSIDQADIAVAKFMYEAGISLTAANSLYFQKMADAISAVGPGYKMPSYRALNSNLLSRCMTEGEELSKELRKSWEITGCTVMVDRLMDTAGRSVINIFVYCPKATIFLKSVDVSHIETTLEGLVLLFESIVQDVDPRNIVHFLSDCLPLYRAAGKVLMDRHKTFFWSVCSKHCIDLMFKGLSEIDEVNGTIAKAKKISQFIYNNAWLLSLLKKNTQGRDIVQPGVTQAMTDYLTLQNIFSLKDSLQQMFTCNAWEESALSKQKLGIEVKNIVFDLQFWQSCAIIVKVSKPLMRVLQLADSGERPSIGYIFDAYQKLKTDILLAFDNQESVCMPYLEVINRVRDELHSPLHAAAYYLNPSFYYYPKFSTTNVIQKGLLDCIEILEPDLTAQDNITKHKSFYEDALGDFSRPMAIRGRESLLPGYPDLQRFAERILSQTCSIPTLRGSCYIYESLHSNNNRIERARLSDVSFVHYNLRLQQRQPVTTETKGPMADGHDLIPVENSNIGDWIDDPGVLEAESINLLDVTLPTDLFSVIDKAGNTSNGDLVGDD